MRRELQQPLRIPPLSEEKETVDAEIVRDQLRDDLRSQLLSYVLLQERRMAVNAIAPAVGYVHCQGNAVGYLLQYDGGHFRDILDHLSM
jgi:hypothetical protein